MWEREWFGMMLNANELSTEVLWVHTNQAISTPRSQPAGSLVERKMTLAPGTRRVYLVPGAEGAA
jgi:hypothetical protein